MAGRLYRMLRPARWPSSSAIPKRLRRARQAPRSIPSVRRRGSALAGGSRSFRGTGCSKRILRLPRRFLSVELRGLARALKAAGGRVKSVILLDRHDPVWRAGLAPSIFPALRHPRHQSFPRRRRPHPLVRTRPEYQVVPDRTPATDFRSALVSQVSASAPAWKWSGEFPFYAPSDAKGRHSSFYTVHEIRGQNRQRACVHLCLGPGLPFPVDGEHRAPKPRTAAARGSRAVQHRDLRCS